jgi:mannan endo-1,4-beta-mannosidase
MPIERGAISVAAIAAFALSGMVFTPGTNGGLAIPSSIHTASPAAHFVTANGDKLQLDGKPYEFAGANNYYLGYKSTAMTDAVLDDANKAGFDVIRTWGFQDYQNPDGSGSVQQGFEGVWYQAWDASAGKPVVNTGVNGLQKLDYVIAQASARGIRLIIPFTNNWNNFGGMDQYVRWAGDDEHADFYTDPVINGWYKNWISTLLNRTNSISGVKYKNDPTIMAWELANEPRCTSAGAYPDGTCNTTIITNWARTMSDYVKTIDKKHLLSAGDEGFFCLPEAKWTLTQKYGPSQYGAGLGEDCKDGIDTIALASLPSMDMMSMHLYPDNWKESTAWGTGWIKEHAAAAAKIGKPVYLGEFGLLDEATRMPVFNEWLRTVRQTGVDGSLYWILSSKQDDGTPYADYDGFTVYCPSPVCSLISAQAKPVPALGVNLPTSVKVFADNDAATTKANAPVDVNVMANDVGITVPPSTASLDLDPMATGRQTRVKLTGGTASIVSPGVVRVVPTAGFVGTIRVPYSVSNGFSNSTATLVVTVKPATF